MRNKLLTLEEFEKTFSPHQKLVFHENSPFSKITAPKGTIFFATHWNDPCTTITSTNPMTVTTGTAYVCCVGDSKTPIKFYAYYLRLNSDESGVVLDIRKPDLEYHHVGDIKKIPSFITSQAPKEFLTKISKALNAGSALETNPSYKEQA